MNVTRLCEYVGCDDAILMKVHDLLGYASVIIVPTEVFITETARDELPQEAVVRALSRHFRGD